VSVLVFGIWIAKSEGRKKEKLYLALTTIVVASALNLAYVVYLVNPKYWWVAVLFGVILLALEAVAAWVSFEKDGIKEKISVV
jgi:NhaP-type Na+/H+ or K+/H+ antiporter